MRFKAIPISPQKRSRHTETNGQMGLNTQHLQSSNKPLASRGNGLDLITVFSSEHTSDITASILIRKVIIDAQEEERVAGFNTNWFCCILQRQRLWNGMIPAMQSWNLFFKISLFKTFSSTYLVFTKKQRFRCRLAALSPGESEKPKVVKPTPNLSQH